MRETEKLEDILDEAKAFKKDCNRHKQKVTFNDYERFKRKLHDNGYFGYESILSNIIGV